MIKKRERRGQISMEYLIVTGFVVFVIVGILGVALYYSTSLKDGVTTYNLNNFGNKVTSAAESVFYSGSPSQATISAYLPEGVREIGIVENAIYMNVSTSTGILSVAYFSDVPIVGNITTTSGVKRITLYAQDSRVLIVNT
jgi:uncharacterized protein (UPF0333 family)